MKISHQNILASVFCIFLASTLFVNGLGNENEKKIYIVYMGDLPEGGVSAEHHHELLSSALGVHSSIARESHVLSYTKSFNAFAAKLLPHEVQKLREDKNVITVFENRVLQLHTTRSWDFLGMPLIDQTNATKAHSDVIVGVLDTGIDTSVPSFDDKGVGPPPAKWKGKCIKGKNFTGCNNKVIGVQWFNLRESLDYNMRTPADYEGHGTHTASTIAGAPLKDASMYGIAKGTVRGGMPSARIAMYKVCWTYGCGDADVLSGFDAAIADGVDVISVSLGGFVRAYFQDAISIGSFHAMKKGIFTSCSGGNSGPELGTAQNVAPWYLTVAASSIDRGFETVVQLGNGRNISGISINTFSPKKKTYPLVDGPRAASRFKLNTSACEGLRDEEKVKGRIIYCQGELGKEEPIRNLSGAGIIMTREDSLDIANSYLISGTAISISDGKLISKYIRTTKNAQAVIHKTRTYKPKDSPIMASFSSRGPQRLVPTILKPDISAPGLNILAGYSKLATTSDSKLDPRHYPFNILSGTSMACPHATAAAVYVKTVHPKWSPAAIKSALMTTATPIRDPNGALATGSGQLNPVRALHPGLIYDINISGYTSFLCQQGYENLTLGWTLRGSVAFNCSGFKPLKSIDGLNYPSFASQIVGTNTSISATYYRIVTNVGHANSVYKATVNAPKGLSVKVIPDTLKFERVLQKKVYRLFVKGTLTGSTEFLFGSLEWNDGTHSVRSPIVVSKSFSW